MEGKRRRGFEDDGTWDGRGTGVGRTGERCRFAIE